MRPCHAVWPDVAEEMWRSREQFLEGGRLQPRLLHASILFTDLHNFTAVAERLSPPELMDWLNLYMDRMAGLVMQHGGVIDDYFGDAIKALERCALNCAAVVSPASLKSVITAGTSFFPVET